MSSLEVNAQTLQFACETDEMSAKRDILVIQTRGTIDKDYPKAIGGYAFEIGEPAVKRVLERCMPMNRVSYVTTCRKDSQEITEKDRQQLADDIENSESDRVLITHGTDTMIETARYLDKWLKMYPECTDKIVVITGSRKPETFKDSDADFNIGVAVGAMQCMAKGGVYVAMNGCVYDATAVRRDEKTGQFVAEF